MGNWVRLFIVGALLLCHLQTNAKYINEADARQKAYNFLFYQLCNNSGHQRSALARQPLELTYADDGCYVFNGTNCFAIVSKEDSPNAILGYSDQGSFNAETMPDEVRAWLKSLSVQAETPAKHDAIQPLLTTEWGQGRPYNMQLLNWDCPTGCVATAMAQVMAYHKWPDIVDKDVNELPSTTFDWLLMRNQYEPVDTDNSAQEVAKLMKYCGAAVCMHYDYKESGAYFHSVVDALKYFFGYARSIRDIYRSSYTTEEWDSLIYNELAQGRPVLYSGVATKGHAMVCDGYDGNGCYHINFGWDGGCDGFYRMPFFQDFSLNQAAIIGIEKATEPYEYEHCLSYGIIDEWTYHSIYKRNSNGQLGVGFKIAWSDYADGWGWNSSIHEAAGGLYKNHELIEILPLSYNTRIGDVPSFIYAVRIGSNVPDGQYQLKTLYRKKNTEEWIEPLRSDGELFDLYIHNDSLTIKRRGEMYAFPKASEIELTNIAVEGDLQAGSQQTLLLTLQNKGTAKTGKLNGKIWSSKSYAYNGTFGYGINPGETGVIEMPFTPEIAGEYNIVIGTNDWGYIEIGNGTVTITEASTGISDVGYDLQCLPASTWSVNGQKGKRSGLNIVRYSNGSVRKVMIK